MSQTIRHNPKTSSARAVAVSRAQSLRLALTTLILSVVLGLLSGAVWMQLT